jgi:hypothetical protein
VRKSTRKKVRREQRKKGRRRNLNGKVTFFIIPWQRFELWFG